MPRRDQVIASLQRVDQKLLRHYGAHRVRALVAVVGTAEAVTEVTRHRIRTACLQRTSKYIAWFGCHGG
jgi:hypothetical protein